MNPETFRIAGGFGVGLGFSSLLSLSAKLNPNLGLKAVFIPIGVLLLLLALAINDETISKLMKTKNENILFALIGTLGCLITGGVLQWLN